MSILSLYLSRSLVSGWLLVLAVASAVFGLLFFVSEMERVTDSYTLTDVAIYVALSLPARILDLAPVGVLFGTLLVLSGLEKGSELTVVTMAGIGTLKLLKLMALPLALLMAGLWLAEEYVTAPLHRQAEEHRAETYGFKTGLLGGSLWMRDGNRYVHLGGVDKAGQPRSIDIYTLAADGELIRAIHADRGTVIADRQWRLFEVTVKERQAGVLTTRAVAELEMDNLWTRKELPSLPYSSASMSPSVLYRYIGYLRDTGQKVEFYDLSFWNRLLLPLNCAAMMLLATPIGGRPGSARNTSLGRQLGLGALIGIFFYLGAQVVYAVGLIAGIHPAITSSIPVVATFAVAVLLWWKTRW